MMASKTFSGQLDQAMDELAAEGNKILFIPQQNVGEVLEGAASEMTVESDGTYSIKLAYNTYSIYHYSDVTKRKRLLADGIVVSSETTVTTIPGLIGSTVPVTEDSVLTIQGYLDEANEAKTDAEAAKVATEALYEDFDSNVAGSMALVHTDTPSLSIPFNESGRLDYGVGAEYVSGLPVYGVDFTRSTASTVINKSGVLETLAADEVGIGADGVWLHGAYTNYLSSPMDISSSDWVKNEATTSSDGVLTESTSTSAHSIYYSGGHALTEGDTLTYQVLVKLTDERGVGISIDGGGFGGTAQKIVVNKDGEVLFSLGLSSYEVDIVGDGVLVVSITTTAAASSTTVGVRLYIENTESETYLESYEGDGVSSIEVYALNLVDASKQVPFLSTASTATATSCTVPVNGNLPTTGKSCTWVMDTNTPELGESNRMFFRVSGDSTSGGFIGVLISSAGGLTVRSGSDGVGDVSFGSVGGNSSYVDGGENRFAFVYDADAETITAYINGNPNSIGAVSVSGMTFPSDGSIIIGSALSDWYLNAQLKNFKILPYAASADEVKSWGAPK